MKHGTKSAFITGNSGVTVGVGVGVSVGSWEHKVTVVIDEPEFCHHKTYLGVDTSDVADNARYLFAKLVIGRLEEMPYITSPVVNWSNGFKEYANNTAVSEVKRLQAVFGFVEPPGEPPRLVYSKYFTRVSVGVLVGVLVGVGVKLLQKDPQTFVKIIEYEVSGAT